MRNTFFSNIYFKIRVLKSRLRVLEIQKFFNHSWSHSNLLPQPFNIHSIITFGESKAIFYLYSFGCTVCFLVLQKHTIFTHLFNFCSLKDTRNSSKKRPLDFEKKQQLSSEKCSAKYQLTHMRLSPLHQFANLFTVKLCLWF